MQYLPILLCMLACPVMMGLTMWMTCTDQGHSRPAREPRTFPAAQCSQDRQAQKSLSPMGVIMSCVKQCLNWKVLAGLTAVALVIGLMAPGWFSTALPVLLVLICPLSMLIMPIAMRSLNRSRGQNSSAGMPCCVPSAEVAPEPVFETPRSEMPERDPVKY